MADRPNILFLMTDQMQGRVLDPAHPCRTPHLDALAAGGVRFSRAYTPNAVCSPARASLMTGLLPHNHGVLWVTHTMDRDQCVLRTQYPHWGQLLHDVGYRTGYFGKWHVEHSECPADFGWDVDASMHSERFTAYRAEHARDDGFEQARYYENQPEGYQRSLFSGVTKTPPEHRSMGLVTDLAEEFLRDAVRTDGPWCCVASVPEPHDPFVAGRDAYALYDSPDVQPGENWHDELAGRPGIYRKSARIWDGMDHQQRLQAARCYYASITEIDAQFGRLLGVLEESGRSDDTIVVFTADHGELLGAHGMYCKNFSAAEEIYHIPMIVRGPGLRVGEISSARVGSHDLYPTLLELCGVEGPSYPDSATFAPALRDAGADARYTTGFAEYSGSRYLLTQRVYWEGEWKFVLNGFDEDELYNLTEDPGELRNLAQDPAHETRRNAMMAEVWRIFERTGDRTLLNSQYPILRIAPVGPEWTG